MTSPGSFGSPGGAGFGAHSDVLGPPVPADKSGKQRLLEELKRRGRAAVQGGAWPDASALYGKALECVDAAEDTEQVAILESNAALVQGKMNKWQMSRDAAKRATEAHPAYTKGWWRLGQAEAALENYDEAVAALQEGIRLEPENKALQKELASKQKEQEEYKKKKQAEAEAQAETETSTETKVTRTEIVDERNQPKAEKAKKDPSAMEVESDGATFTASEHVKGYKIVNGKKTSYFHNELSEEAARLIGDIAPKKLEASAVETTTATAVVPPKGASAWNKAGTWEEKDVTAWAVETLQSRLAEAKFTLPASSPAPGATVRATKVTVPNAAAGSHASVATVRGKKRYIYELSATLEWEFEHDNLEARGSIRFPDIGQDGEGEYEVTGYTVTHADEGSMRHVLDSFVHRQGWRDEVHRLIGEWIQFFKDSY